MKKFYMILAVITALTMTMQANTGTIAVGDWDNASTYDGSFFDMAPTSFYLAHTGAQMIYTPDLLTDLDGKQNVVINTLQFKFQCQSWEDISRNVKIYLQETDATEFAVIEGIKQFFTFDEPVYEAQYDISLVDYYGDDCTMEFPVNFAFTPGKSLLVTMVFDALDDDNCTMGSDYAPFYTSGITGRGMTYTNNWTSFIDYAQGEDFPDATAVLGCGTNVALPVTQIGYTYDDAPTIVPAVPADPVLYEDAWFDSGEEDGYSCLDFYVPAEDVDGNEIDRQYLLYSIFTDDDIPFVFDAETYMYDIEEDMTEIPYEVYFNGYDFDVSRIYFYRTNTGDNPMFTRRIGIQVHYDVPVTINGGKAANIVRNSSNIVYWYLSTTAINDVRNTPSTDNAYYNLMGVKFNTMPTVPGIYIHNGKKVIVK